MTNWLEIIIRNVIRIVGKDNLIAEGFINNYRLVTRVGYRESIYPSIKGLKTESQL